jgi:hypothetical protein
MKKIIIVTIGAVDFPFNVTVQDHSDFIDAAARGASMTASAHNFVMRTIDDKSKEEFKKLLESSPGAEIQIAGELKAEFSPVLEISIKK